MINSVDLNKFDLNENLDNEETLENINILKEKILNSFNDLPNQTIDGEISNRLINNINKLNHQQKNLFTKIEKEFKNNFSYFKEYRKISLHFENYDEISIRENGLSISFLI